MNQVIIIGAGPSGSYLAYLLASSGIDVLVLEKERFPRYKPCGGGITPKVVNLLDFDLSPVIEDTIQKVIFSYRLTRPIEFTAPKPLAYMVARERFDALLAVRAKEAGAKFLEGIRVQRVEVTGSKVSVYADGSQWQGDILVGADGANSLVARSLGLGRRRKLSASLETEIPAAPEKLEQYRSAIKIEYGLVPYGYAWVFPKADHLSAGVWTNAPRPKKLRLQLEYYIQSEGLNSLEARVKTRGWLIPVNPQPDDLHGSRTLLLGDAAGLADAFTGEGIYPAVYSARLAAEIISGQISRPDPDLRGYTALVQEKIGPDLAGSFRLTRWIPPISGLIHRVLHRHQDLIEDFMEVAGGNLSYSSFLQYFRSRLKESLHFRR
ncbi:geranylgeranyl reductase family protein [Pelotomaculum propionicicum]|uniref:Menaquinone reductase n=1 Tax=Pelotomaculum propionicicum TaxID=258475 RepID=A0A4Y7RVG1_9FIRM|nr:geranylgeranyl reductase family protein [Pelotomaculum propionicicum]TEB12719.1 Menaquinone reductase [Pelotomaculum propionicicum]